MSASGPPTPMELVDRFGIDPLEAQAIADALGPAQDLSGIGASVGSAMEAAEATGPQFVGVALQNISKHMDLTASNLETLAKAIEFYLESQSANFEELFPPPDEAAKQFGDDIEPLAEALGNLANRNR